MNESTTHRVAAHTSGRINEKIRQQGRDDVVRFASQGPEAIDARLAELDREWDVERTLEANAATLSLLGCALGAAVDRRFFALPAVVAGFLLQHAVQGWCPPLAVLRRLGVRTTAEINHERYALKALRGDFANVRTNSPDARRALEAARA